MNRFKEYKSSDCFSLVSSPKHCCITTFAVDGQQNSSRHKKRLPACVQCALGHICQQMELAPLAETIPTPKWPVLLCRTSWLSAFKAHGLPASPPQQTPVPPSPLPQEEEASPPLHLTSAPTCQQHYESCSFQPQRQVSWLHCFPRQCGCFPFDLQRKDLDWQAGCLSATVSSQLPSDLHLERI